MYVTLDLDVLDLVLDLFTLHLSHSYITPQLYVDLTLNCLTSGKVPFNKL